MQKVSNDLGNFQERSSTFDAADANVVFDARLGQQNVGRMSTGSFHGTNAGDNVKSFSGKTFFA